MGNPEMRHPAPAWQRPKPDRNSPNGVLAFVGSEYIGACLRQLPPPGPAEQHQLQRQAVVDVPGLGRVRITFELHKYRHYKTTNWMWSMVRADQVDPLGQPEL